MQMKRVVVGIEGTRKSLIYDVNPTNDDKTNIEEAVKLAKDEIKFEGIDHAIKMHEGQEPDVWIRTDE